MDKDISSRILLPFFLLLLPGCRGYVNWGGCPWHHRQEVVDQIQEGRQYAQSVAVYDRYSARIIFDAIPLADQVRGAYACMVADRYGRSENWLATELRKQLEKNTRYINFYVLTLRERPFSDRCGTWMPRLKVDDKEYEPCEIRAVEMPLEYKHILGPRYTRFKVAYEMVFEARRDDGSPVLDAAATRLTLLFKSADKEVPMEWRVGMDGITFGDTRVVEGERQCV